MAPKKVTKVSKKTLIDIVKNPDDDLQEIFGFTIICDGGHEVKSLKFVLAARSKFFMALFRHEPEKKSMKLDFKGPIVQKIVNSFDGFTHRKEGLDKLFQLFEVANYFQMDHIRKSIIDCIFSNMHSADSDDEDPSDVEPENSDEDEDYYDEDDFLWGKRKDKRKIASKIIARSPSDIVSILKFMETYDCSKLVKKTIDRIVCHIRECFPVFDLKTVPKEILNRILQPSNPDYDDDIFYAKEGKNGKLYGTIASEIMLVQALIKVDPNEDWNFSRRTRLQILYAMEHPTGFNLKEEDIQSMKKFIGDVQFRDFDPNHEQKYDDDTDTKNRNYESQEFFHGIMHQFTHVKPVFKTKLRQSSRWSVTGPFTKIELKCINIEEDIKPGHKRSKKFRIVQGLEIQTEDGIVHKFGTVDGAEKDESLNSWEKKYLSSIVFDKSKSPYINEARMSCDKEFVYDLKFKHDPRELYKFQYNMHIKFKCHTNRDRKIDKGFDVKDARLHGISGFVGNRGQITNLEFTWLTIPYERRVRDAYLDFKNEKKSTLRNGTYPTEQMRLVSEQPKKGRERPVNYGWGYEMSDYEYEHDRGVYRYGSDYDSEDNYMSDDFDGPKDPDYKEWKKKLNKVCKSCSYKFSTENVEITTEGVEKTQG